jgi:outer membrane protein OmpA-like peptidoglycan-associated protein
VLQILANPVVRALTAPQSPVIKGWGKYTDIPVAFRSGSHSEPEDFTALRALGEALQLPPFKEREILIRGYTDNVGESADNLQLSYKRAAFVKEYLIRHYGLDSSKVTIEGKGEESPVASNDTPGGRAKNRRIRVAIR